jgi:phage/plasmid-like protein (TIGR03299 family)
MTSNLISLDTKLGTEITGVTDFDELITRAKLDFKLEKEPLFDRNGKQIKDKFIIRNTDSDSVLGVVGKRYNIVDVPTMVEPFHKNIVKKFDLEYENAGIIENGRKCWVAARFRNPLSLKYRPMDKINNRIFCLITNDGTFRNSYLSMAHRVFCNNQLKLMIKAASESGLGVMHTKNHQRKIDTNMVLINNFLDAGKSFIDKADVLNDKIMAPQEAKAFLDKLMPKNDKKANSKQSMRLIRRKSHIIDLFNSGAGNIGRTRWDMLNAVTEYFDHHNNPNKILKHGTIALEKRFVANTIFGQGVQIKQKALDLLLN